MKKEMTNKYFTTRSLEDGNVISLDVRSIVDKPTNLKYSKDGGKTWKGYVVKNCRTLNVKANKGEEILWKSDGSSKLHFDSTKNYEVEGNIMSLLYYDDFADKTELREREFAALFSGSETLVNAGNLVLPATTLAFRCYYRTFGDCTSLTTAPELPATTLAEECYREMFSDCSLTTAPALPATTLAKSCYCGMFYECVSLTTAPELPATTLAEYCYCVMFNGCTSLTTAPSILPATTLARDCYCNMFWGCTSLTTAPELATTLTEDCYYYMFYGCTNLQNKPA